MDWLDLAKKYALGPLLPEEILTIIWNESTGNPSAMNLKDPSWGLMGVEMGIAQMYGRVTQSQRLFDPDTNIKCGAGFLQHLKTTYSASFPLTWPQGYNQGETNLRRCKPDVAYITAFDSRFPLVRAAVAIA